MDGDIENDIPSQEALDKAKEEGDFIELDETKDIPNDWEMIEKEKDKRSRGVTDKINASDKVLLNSESSLDEEGFEKIEPEGTDLKNKIAAFNPVGEAGLFVGAAGKAMKLSGQAEKADAKSGIIKGEKTYSEAKLEEKLGDASEMTGELGEAIGDVLTLHLGNAWKHGKNIVKAGGKLFSGDSEVDKYRAYSKDSMEREDNAAGKNYKPITDPSRKDYDPNYQPSTKGVPLPPGTKLVNNGKYVVNKEAEKKEKEIQKLLNKEVEGGPSLTDIAEATTKAVKLAGGPDYTKEAKTIFKTDDKRVNRELNKKSLNTRPIDNRRRIDPIDRNINYSAATMAQSEIGDRLNRQYLRTNNLSQRRKANTDNLPPSFDRSKGFDRNQRNRNKGENTVAVKDILPSKKGRSVNDLEESLKIISPGGIQTKNPKLNVNKRIPASNVANLIQKEYEISGELDSIQDRKIKDGIKKIRETSIPPEKIFTDIAEKVIYTHKSQI